jgi:hypothetical protein
MGSKSGVAGPPAEQGFVGMPERHLYAENNWREKLREFMLREIREGKIVLLPGIVARWSCVQGGKPWIEYGKKAMEQLVVRGGGNDTWIWNGDTRK